MYFKPSSVDVSRIKLAILNFLDLVSYLWFWTMPWIASFFTMWLLLYAPINILNLVQLMLIALTLGSHIKKLGVTHFAGMMEI